MKIKYTNMEWAKQKFKQNFIVITYENMNMKWNKQGYHVNFYFILMFNKLKIMNLLALFIHTYLEI